MTINLTVNLDHDTKVRCGNCPWAGLAPELKDIQNLGARVTPGETVPAGQCPQCGSLAHLLPGARHGDAYRRLRALIEAHVPVGQDLNDRLLGFAKTHTLSAMAFMASYHESTEPGLPQTRFDAVHGMLFAAVLCACEINSPIDGTLAFNRLNNLQREALQELLKVADDMLVTTMDAVAISIPEGLEEAVLDPNMTKQ
jgi:hypothetical protein